MLHPHSLDSFLFPNAQSELQVTLKTECVSNAKLCYAVPFNITLTHSSLANERILSNYKTETICRVKSAIKSAVFI